MCAIRRPKKVLEIFHELNYNPLFLASEFLRLVGSGLTPHVIRPPFFGELKRKHIQRDVSDI